MTGQDERADMLAFKRDMPQGIVEVGPVAPDPTMCVCGRTLCKFGVTDGCSHCGQLARYCKCEPFQEGEPLRPLQAWDVYDDDGRKIDRVYFDPRMTALEVVKVVERDVRSLRIGRLDRAGVERCQCGNPYTIRIDEALYCARCVPPTAQQTANEPCLCGDKTSYQCSRSCALSENGGGSGSTSEVSDEQYRQGSIEVLSGRLSDGECQTDDQCQVSRGSDDGAYVQVWIWVPRARAEAQGPWKG